MRRLTLDEVRAYVAAREFVTVAELDSAAAERRIRHARQLAMAMCREFARASYSRIGRRFGWRHHSNVVDSVDAVAIREVCEAKFAAHLAELRAELKDLAQRPPETRA